MSTKQAIPSKIFYYLGIAEAVSKKKQHVSGSSMEQSS